MGDAIKHPDHYCSGGIEVIDIIRAKLTPEQYEGYLLGNTLKYLFRYKLKRTPSLDLAKANVYLGWLSDLPCNRDNGGNPPSSNT
jgi:hypothetical protein